MQSTTKPAAFSKGKTLIDPQNYASPLSIDNRTIEAGKPSSNLQDFWVSLRQLVVWETSGTF